MIICWSPVRINASEIASNSHKGIPAFKMLQNVKVYNLQHNPVSWEWWMNHSRFSNGEKDRSNKHQGNEDRPRQDTNPSSPFIFHDLLSALPRVIQYLSSKTNHPWTFHRPLKNDWVKLHFSQSRVLFWLRHYSSNIIRAEVLSISFWLLLIKYEVER